MFYGTYKALITKPNIKYQLKLQFENVRKK